MPSARHLHLVKPPKVWNVWIIYPVIAWVSLSAMRGWTVYRPKRFPEDEIESEAELQPGAPG